MQRLPCNIEEFNGTGNMEIVLDRRLSDGAHGRLRRRGKPGCRRPKAPGSHLARAWVSLAWRPLSIPPSGPSGVRGLASASGMPRSTGRAARVDDLPAHGVLAVVHREWDEEWDALEAGR
jgi:hypothetical protein